MKKLLFITWDADTSNYLEALFFPIFNKLTKNTNIQIHVIQFSWAKTQEVLRLQQIAQIQQITFSHVYVNKDMWGMLGVLIALFKGFRIIKDYIKNHHITHLMPRSTMPAFICNRINGWLKANQIKLIFDADGLPLEERLDYTSLSANSLQYKFLKKQETIMLLAADSILVRSKAAIEFHRKRTPLLPLNKFHIVSNGRDEDLFHFNQAERTQTRQELGIENDAKLFIYTGSLGPQYALDEMLLIFAAYHASNPNAKLLLLSRMPVRFSPQIPSQIRRATIILQKNFEVVPRYLSAADFAFCLRLPAPSLAGIAPIKLGEYLLMGLPTIISKGIGDLDLWASKQAFLHTYDHLNSNRFNKVLDWMTTNNFPKQPIIDFAKSKLSLNQTAIQYKSAIS
ncbi:hypothetical protein SAMN06295967_105199 [Belliella buryatensis]|uniref:Uncharacterized protein n=1 Tax=Belliella buryatensis TaxID=1500549 RepID=A0A239CRT0_9BACT|nr:glycosyltransferase family 4 protein [Belliella buryatensis]SNS22875.1 hypothetical protein SAMN06295967_105199 [Belliella buryatensis]